MKPCSDVDEKTRSKFIGRVHKNMAVSTLRSSLTTGNRELVGRFVVDTGTPEYKYLILVLYSGLRTPEYLILRVLDTLPDTREFLFSR